jgi:hypothetical protein
MESNQQLREFPRKECLRSFEQAITWVERVFGTEAFRLFRRGESPDMTGRWAPRRMDLLLELEMVGFAEYGDELDQHWESLSRRDKELFRQALRNQLVTAMTDKRLTDAIWAGTTRPEALNARFEVWLRALSVVLNDVPGSIERAQIRQDLAAQHAPCLTCGAVVPVDDAVLDSARAGLTHRACRR